MNKKIVLISLVGLMVVNLSCSNKKGGKQEQQIAKVDSVAIEDSTENTESSANDDSDRLAYWFQYHDSINPGLVAVAEELWKLDSAATISGSRERRVWYEKCKKRLSACYDSIHPGSRMSEIRKAESMLTEIEAFFNKDADESTMGMVVNLSLQNNFVIYRTAAEEHQIMKYDPTFTEELKAWNDLQEAMFVFCVNSVIWEWFGGSGSGPASLAEQNAILQCRLDDLKRIHKLYQKQNGQDSMEKDVDSRLLNANAGFQRAVNKIAKSVVKDEESRNDMSDGQQEMYDDIYDRIHSSDKPLINALDKWMKVRSRFPQAGSNAPGFKENTVTTIKALTKCVVDILEEE